MKGFLTILFLVGLSTGSVHAQKIISGIVIDSVNEKPMAGVSVENITNKSGSKTNYRGTFSITVENDHYLKVSYVGFKPRIIRIKDLEKTDFLRIKLAIGRITLQKVKIVKPLTAYQKDSIARTKIYRDIYKYKQEKSGFSPVTTVFQKISRKHKNLRRFKEQVLAMEREKFIDSRYTREMVGEITKLTGNNLGYFMNAYPMALDFARTASELELRMWVRYNWDDYQKKNQGKE